MTAIVSDITSADWSIQVGNPGEVVTELEDIEQCIGIILTTRKGSDPHRPLFGCDAWLWLDKPGNVAIPHIIMESVDSLVEWEPRLDLLSVTAQADTSGDVIFVEWQPKGQDISIKTEVRLDTAA